MRGEETPIAWHGLNFFIWRRRNTTSRKALQVVEVFKKRIHRKIIGLALVLGEHFFVSLI